MKTAFIGHVSVDINEIRGEAETHYGGGVFHGAITTHRLGAKALAVTKCAAADQSRFSGLEGSGVETVYLASARSTSIRNVYPSENPDDRQSYLISRADSFTTADLSHLDAEAAHINPLWFGEFPPELFAEARKRFRRLSADAQGLLRQPDPDGKLVYRDFEGKRDLLPLFDAFKVDTKEAAILTGETEVRKAARAVRALGPAIVILTHKDGVCVFDGHEHYEAKFSGFTLEGRTGRGDTCTAAFLVKLSQTGSLREATQFAAEITSIKMQYRGPYRG